MEKTYKEYLEEILCSPVSDDLTSMKRQALDAVTELLGFCDYERLCELAKANSEKRNITFPEKFYIGQEIFVIEGATRTGLPVDVYRNFVKGFSENGIFYKHSPTTPVYFEPFENIGKTIFLREKMQKKRWKEKKMETGFFEKQFLSKKTIYEKLREIGSSYGEHMAVDKESAVCRCSDTLMMEKPAKVAPVRYARWVIDKESKHEKIVHCSHCGKRPVEKKYAVRGNGYVIYHCHAILTDFCPNCGAKMVGK